MTVKDIADKLGLETVNLANAEINVAGAYTCDLLSWVIGRAQTNDLLITIMSNANTVAVSVMADLAGIILTEGVKLDEAALAKAKANDVNVFTAKENSFVLSAKLKNLLDGE